jgi:hypothetical protein
MRLSIRNPLRRKSDQIAGQAAAVEDAVDDPLDETTLGLDVWVQGVNSIVEYVSLIIPFVSSTCLRLSYLLTAANRYDMILASLQYTASTVTEKRPGRPRTT